MEVGRDKHTEEVGIARVAILDETGRLLVLHRSDDDEYGAGEPDLPGGTIDPDETAEEAVVRETLEETGVELAAMVLRRVCEVITTSTADGKATRITRIFFAACVQSPTIVLSPEHKGFGWEALETAEELFVNSPSKQQCVTETRGLYTSGSLAA